MKATFLLFLLIIIGRFGFSQIGFKDSSFALDDKRNSIFVNFDIKRIGDYFYSYGYGFAIDSNRQSLFVIKSDEHGRIIDHRYHYSGRKELSYWDFVVNRPEIVILDSNRFVVILVDLATNNNEVFCIDTNLNKIWNTTIEMNINNLGEIPRKMIYDGENIFIAIWPQYKNNKFINTKIVKINNDGEIQWQKISDKINFLWGLSLSNNKKDLLLSGQKIEKYDEPYDNLVIKFDTTFNYISEVKVRRESYIDFGYNLLQTSSSRDYITDSYDILPTPPSNPNAIGTGYGLNITRRDSNLNVIWKIPVWASTSHENGFADIIPSGDGNYYAFAQVVDIKKYVGPPDGIDSIDALTSLIVKFNEEGEVLWTRKDVFDLFEFTNQAWTNSGGIVAMEDGGAMVNGFSLRRFENDFDDLRGWMMRVDANGCVIAGDCGISSTIEYGKGSDSFVDIYPNPTYGSITISSSTSGFAEVAILNSMGTLLLTKKIDIGVEELVLDLSSFYEGIYFLQISDGRNLISIKKIVKL